MYTSIRKPKDFFFKRYGLKHKLFERYDVILTSAERDKLLSNTTGEDCGLRDAISSRIFHATEKWKFSSPSGVDVACALM